MNKFSRFSALVVALTATASFAFADTISLGSFATGTSAASLGFSSNDTAMNFAGYTAFSSPPPVAVAPPLQNGTASTYALSPAPYWGGPIGSSTWVGYASTAGPGGVQPLYGYYQFNTEFTAFEPSNPYSGSISVMGDDTVEVLLNGSVIVPFGVLGSDARCADAGPNCRATDTVQLSSLMLLGGTDANTLTFIVEQAGVIGPYGGDPSGMDFTANLSAPEPSGLILLGTGLLGAASMLWRRRRIA